MRPAGHKIAATLVLASALAVRCEWPAGGEAEPLTVSSETVTLVAEEGSTVPVEAAAEVTFDGPAVVVWTVSTDEVWLSVEPGSGATGYGSPAAVTVTGDPTGLAAGLWTGHVTFEDLDGVVPDGVITVQLYIAPPEPASHLFVEPSPVALQALAGVTTPVSTGVTLSLAGGANVAWEASWPAPDTWLALSETAGTLSDGGSAPLTLSADPNLKPAALYTSTVTFSTPGGEASPIALAVSLAVRPAAAGPGALVSYQSRIDLSIQPYGLRLPLGFAATGNHPVVLSMHAYDLSADTAFTGGTDRADENAWILVGLHGRGNHQYDGAAETDLFEVLADLDGAYGVDWTRVFMEGYSMGGQGAFRFIARFPGVFAGSAAGAGWNDYYQFHRHYYGPEDNVLTPTVDERYGVHPGRFSNLEYASALRQAENILPGRLYFSVGGTDGANWAENGLKLGGRLDRLATAYTIKYDAGEGHSTAFHTASERYDFLAGEAPFSPIPPLELDPDGVTIRSNRLRTASHAWLRVGRFGWNGFAEVDAVRDTVGETIAITARNVERFTISSAPTAGPYAITVNAVPCGSHSLPVTIELELDGTGSVISGGAYTPPGSPALAKTPSLEGPIGWAMTERFVVAYGSSQGPPGVPATDRNKSDAEELCKAWTDDWTPPIDTPGQYGFNAVILPVDEATLTRNDLASANLAIFGSEESSKYIARMCQDPTLPFSLPVRVLEDEVIVDEVSYPVGDHGIWMCYPNPLSPGKLVLVGHNVVGSGADSHWGEILWTRESYPWSWPDYVVFDTVAPMGLEADGQEYSPDQFVVADHFDRDWGLVGATDPVTDVDIVAPTVGQSFVQGTASVTVTVDVTDEIGALVEGLGEGSFAVRVDGEALDGTALGATWMGEVAAGRYGFVLDTSGLLQYNSGDPDPGVTTYELTVEVVRPHPVTGGPLAGLGRTRFFID